MTLQRVNELLHVVAAATARVLSEFEALAVQARRLQAETSADLEELQHWMGLVSMDTGPLSGPNARPTLDGHDVRLDAMREDVTQIALAAARAAILLKSVTSVRDVLETALRHFTGEDALASTFDSTNEHLQIAVSDAREVERRRLASDIHDGPAQVLANAVNLVEVAEHVARRQPDQVADELRQVRQFLREGVDEVRQFMHDLRPTTLEVLGLEVSLERLTTQFCARFGIKSSFKIDNGPIPGLPPKHDVAIYRILQESLQNVRKHAGPDVSVDVSVLCQPDSLTLTIIDDGVGFDPMLVAPRISSGNGILGMRDRAPTVHGQFTVESRPGEGSKVTFTLPIDGALDSPQKGPSEAGPGGTS